MKLDLSEIARNVGMRYHYAIDEPPFEAEGVVFAEPIRGIVDFTNTGRAIVAKGEFETTARLECGRCLNDFSIPVSSVIDESFEIQALATEAPEEEVPVAEAEEELEPFFVENVLDLEELIRQSVILALPIRPLCRDDCKGLCLNCGQNLNDGQCGCQATEGSGPFGRLADVLKAKEEDTES